MKTYTAKEAVAACRYGPVFADFEGYDRVSPAAVKEFLRSAHASTPAELLVRCDDHLGSQLAAVRALLTEEKTLPSLYLDCHEALPPGLAPILRASPAALFLSGRPVEDPALLGAIGAVTRPIVIMTYAASTKSADAMVDMFIIYASIWLK